MGDNDQLQRRTHSRRPRPRAAWLAGGCFASGNFLVASKCALSTLKPSPYPLTCTVLTASVCCRAPCRLSHPPPKGLGGATSSRSLASGASTSGARRAAALTSFPGEVRAGQPSLSRSRIRLGWHHPIERRTNMSAAIGPTPPTRLDAADAPHAILTPSFVPLCRLPPTSSASQSEMEVA